MKTGLKVWLWFIFVVNIISTITVGLAALIVPMLWASVAAEILLIVGICLLLFGKKKVGFYLICGCAVISFVINLIAGTNLVSAIFGLVACPLITFLLMKSDWENFQ